MNQKSPLYPIRNTKGEYARGTTFVGAHIQPVHA